MRRSLLVAAAMLSCLAAAAQAPSPVPSAQLPSPGSAADAALKSTLLANSTALFSAFQHRNVLGFLAGITPEFTYVGPEGVLSIEALAGTVESCTLMSYTVSTPQMHPLTADSAVLVYRHHQEAACNGKSLPQEMIGTDTYVRKDSRWLISLHTETVPK